MIRLVYVSTATRHLTDADIDALLERSAALNAARDITGLLVFNGHNFLQVLEGRKSDVLGLVETIGADERNHGLIVLSVEEISERATEGWSMMGARSARAGNRESLLVANGVATEIVSRLPANLRSLVSSFNSLAA